LTPRIVNGVITADFPSVGLLMNEAETAFCTGTLIGCSTFITAAHCVCPPDTFDYVDCLVEGVADPSQLKVFFQHGGFRSVSKVAVNPDYRFSIGSDVALLTLSEPVSGIAPSPLDTTGRIGVGMRATITGFGTAGGMTRAGIKRTGTVMTQPCSFAPDSDNICWSFAPGQSANTCHGDSGGPLFIDADAGITLAGVTSGFAKPQNVEDCAVGVLSFESTVFAARGFIQAKAGSDIDNRSCGPLPEVGSDAVSVFEVSDTLGKSKSEARYTITVPPDTAELRVELNGELGLGQTSIDFDLYVKQGREPTTTDNDCADTRRFVLGDCRITNPTPGTWNVLVKRANGSGMFQLTATTFATSPPCAGDCDGTGQVTVDKIITLMNIALGESALSVCGVGDINGDGQITVDELLVAVTNALNGCPTQ